MTSTAGKKDTYAFYVAGQSLFAVPAMLEKFPELAGLVKNFGLKTTFTGAELRQELALSPERAKLFLDILVRHNVILAGSGDTYSWNEVEVRELLPVTITDDFVAS